MGILNYITPVESLTLSDQKEYRMRAVAAGIARAMAKDIGNEDDIPSLAGQTNEMARMTTVLNHLKGGGEWPRSLDCREFQPTLDAGATNDFWETAALAARGTAYTVFNGAAAPTLAANKEAVFYKVGIFTTTLPVSRLTFRSGGATGNILAIFDLEQLYNALRPEGYFSEPVVIDKSLTFAVQVLARLATGVLAAVQLGGLIFEPSGQTIA